MPPLSRNHNHTVCTTRTILCRSCRIFQYRNILNILERQTGQRADSGSGQQPIGIIISDIFLRNPVNQRSRRPQNIIPTRFFYRNIGYTPNRVGSDRTRCAVVLLHIQTRDTPLQQLHHIRNRSRRQVLCFNHRNSGTDISPCLSLIGHDNGFVHGIHTLFHKDIHILGSLIHLHFYGTKPHIRKHQCGFFICIHFKRPIHSGQSTAPFLARTISYDYGYTGNRLFPIPDSFIYMSCDFHNLRVTHGSK